MTINAPTNHEAKSRAATQVAAWKDDILSFFDHDWNRLRTLIMELEEQTWNDDSSVELNGAQGNHRNSVPPRRVADSSGEQNTPNDTNAEPKLVIKDRLTELAERIERRLQNANMDGSQARG